MASGRTRINVVIDGSNVIAGGSRGSNSNGHRLISAIEVYEKKGYRVLPRMNKRTYGWMKHNDGSKSQGFEAIKRLVRDKKEEGMDILIEDDDLYLINLALEESAWLVTNDTFENYWKDGEEVQRERAIYPEIRWSELDEYTWGTGADNEGRVRPNEDWRVDGSNFLHPRLQSAPGMALKDENSELRVLLSDFTNVLEEIEICAEKHPHQDLDHVKEIRRHIGYHSARLGKMIEIIPKPSIPSSKDDLNSKTVDVLKQYCDLLGLKKSGLKGEIVDRILEEQSDSVDSGLHIEDEIVEEGTKELEEIIGFSKSEFISALLGCKKSREKESYATTYATLIGKNPKYNLKNHSIKANWFLEECGEIVDFEIREKDNSKHYWI